MPRVFKHSMDQLLLLSRWRINNEYVLQDRPQWLEFSFILNLHEELNDPLLTLPPVNRPVLPKCQQNSVYRDTGRNERGQNRRDRQECSRILEEQRRSV